MTSVGVGLEANEVAAEHSIEDSLATCRVSERWSAAVGDSSSDPKRTGEVAEVLRRGEGAVKEERDVWRSVGEELAKHLGNEEKVVVVDPDL